MSRYIKADALIKRWNKMSVRGRTEFDQEMMVAPSIDIVRCKECIWFDTGNTGEDYCTYVKGLADAKADDFCSYGEREGE